MKDMGSLSYFLSISISGSSKFLHLSQSKYILDVLDRFDMSGCKPVPSLVVTQKLSKLDGKLLSDPSQYRSIVGTLQYITLTRPDISFDVNQAC